MSLTLTPIGQTKEVYVPGFGLKGGLGDQDWMEEWLEIKESSMGVFVGCIEETNSQDVDVLLSTFHGCSLEGATSSLCIRLTHSNASTILTVSKEGEIIYEETIEQNATFYPGSL